MTHVRPQTHRQPGAGRKMLICSFILFDQLRYTIHLLPIGITSFIVVVRCFTVFLCSLSHSHTLKLVSFRVLRLYDEVYEQYILYYLPELGQRFREATIGAFTVFDSNRLDQRARCAQFSLVVGRVRFVQIACAHFFSSILCAAECRSVASFCVV